MSDPVAWIWVLIPLAGIAIVPIRIGLSSKKSRSMPRQIWRPKKELNMPSMWNVSRAGSESWR